MNTAVLEVLEGTVKTLLPQHVHPSDYLLGMMNSKKRVETIPASSLRLRLASEAPTEPDAHFIMENIRKTDIMQKIQEKLIAQLKSSLSKDVDISSE